MDDDNDDGEDGEDWEDGDGSLPHDVRHREKISQNLPVRSSLVGLFQEITSLPLHERGKFTSVYTTHSHTEIHTHIYLFLFDISSLLLSRITNDSVNPPVCA